MLRKFFFQRYNFTPNGPDLGEKGGQKRPVAPKKGGIFVTWSVHRFFSPKFNPVLDFSPRGQAGQPFSFPNGGAKNQGKINSSAKFCYHVKVETAEAI
jgi:hypothetical protein